MHNKVTCGESHTNNKPKLHEYDKWTSNNEKNLYN